MLKGKDSNAENAPHPKVELEPCIRARVDIMHACMFDKDTFLGSLLHSPMFRGNAPK